MRISLILARSLSGVIGNRGDLPWHLPRDLRRFKKLTVGKPIIMGRKTHESIGRALPHRPNIVVTRQVGYEAKGCTVVPTPDDAIASCGAADEVMVIGGAEIYRAFLPRAQRIYLTEVLIDVEGDTVFDELPESEWRELSSERDEADEDHAHASLFRVLERS